MGYWIVILVVSFGMIIGAYWLRRARRLSKRAADAVISGDVSQSSAKEYRPKAVSLEHLEKRQEGW